MASEAMLLAEIAASLKRIADALEAFNKAAIRTSGCGISDETYIYVTTPLPE